MRVIPFVLAAFVASSPALAQGWEEHAYPNYSFAVAFPANPQVETTTYHVADNRSVPAHLYSVRQGNIVFKMTVAELEGTDLEESAVIEHAIKMLSQGATVRVNIPARIYRVYGRQLTVEGADGSRSMVQLFDYKKRFYQIEAQALPGENVSNPQSDVVRFHQSLTFTDGGSNRSEEAVRAIPAARLCPLSPDQVAAAGKALPHRSQVILKPAHPRLGSPPLFKEQEVTAGA